MVWISAAHFSPPSSDKKNSGSALRAMARHVLAAAPTTSSSAGRQINRLTIGPDLATILSMLPMAILLGRKTRRSQKRATGSSVTGPLPGAAGDSESTSSAPAPLPISSPLENRLETPEKAPQQRDDSPKNPQTRPHETQVNQRVRATTASSRVLPRISIPTPRLRVVAMLPPITPMTTKEPRRQLRPRS